MRWLSAFVGTAMLGHLGCSSPTYLEDLKTPALVWTQSTGLCSKIVAVDGDRVVRTNQGCEDGRPDLHEVRTATQAQVDDLWAKFDMLPFDQAATLEMCAGRLLQGFDRWDPQMRRGTSTCGGSQYDDISGLDGAFLPLAEALKGLE